MVGAVGGGTMLISSMKAIAAKAGSVCPVMTIWSTRGAPVKSTRCVAPGARVCVCTVAPLFFAARFSAVLSSKLPAISECRLKLAPSLRETVQVRVEGAVSSARTPGASGSVS